MKTKHLTLSLALFASISLWAQTSGTCGPNLTWTLQDSVLTISGTGAMNSYYDNDDFYRETPWFSYRNLIASVIIQQGVTSIEKNAFDKCGNLTSVNIPNSVTKIGNNAFYNCSSLTSISIPNTVTSIGDYAFFACSSLTSITIPDSVTSIGNYTFFGCQGLSSVTIPNSVKRIGNSAFSSCSGLSFISIPNGITRIDNDAFNGCTNLTSISIPRWLSDLGVRAFGFCSNLSTVFWNAINCSDCSYYSPPFVGCSNITSFIFGDGVKSIPKNLCQNLSKVNTITIPYSVQSIGTDAFYGCDSLKTVIINSNSIVGKQSSTVSYVSQFFGTQVTQYIIGDSVTNIGNYAFYGCSSLTSLTLSNSISEIGNSAFNSCINLATINFPESIMDCGDFAFIGCYSLTSPIYNSHVFAYMPPSYSGSYDIPDGIEQLAGGAFSSCTGLTSITIPNSVSRIGSAPFSGCTGLTSPVFNSHVFAHMPKTYSGSYSIPDGIESIAGGAFLQCTSLTSVTIPSSVSSIGCSAFNYCSSLDNVICKGLTSPQIVDDHIYGESFVGLFFQAPLSMGIYVPCNTLDDYKNADYWKTYKYKIQNAPSSVQGMPLVVGTGYVSCPRTICENSIKANPSYGYEFVKWNDGNVDNPRIIDPEIEATYIAEFAVSKSGRCGDDLLLTWIYDSDSKKLTISGNGTLDSNIQFGIEAPFEMEVLEIADGVQTIGERAFSEVSTLQTAHIGKDVRKINNYAFNNCYNLRSIYNYRPTPCAAYDNTFNEVDKFACTIYVPAGSEDMYRAATGWKDFYTIQGFESGISNISADADVLELLSNPATRIFTLQGYEVSANRYNLSAGVYILRLNNQAAKVTIR